MSDEREPTAEELRDAEALARALDGEPGVGGAEDAREVAALLRYANDAELDAEARERIRASLVETPSRRRLPRGWIAAPLAAAAALSLVWLGDSRQAYEPASQSADSAPAEAEERPLRGVSFAKARRHLLEAQAQALAGQDAELEALARANGAYRGVWLAELTRRAGERH